MKQKMNFFHKIEHKNEIIFFSHNKLKFNVNLEHRTFLF